MTLIEFLHARLNEDWDRADLVKGWVGGGGPLGEVIKIWNPERIKADVESKREIIDHCRMALWQEEERMKASGSTYPSSAHWGLAMQVLNGLGEPYRDHPDFDPTWSAKP